MAKVSKSVRRRQDYLRRSALQVGKRYEGTLVKARRREVKRVLDLCQNDYADVSLWGDVIKHELDEPYLGKWFRGLNLDVGMPQARAVAEGMRRAKAMNPEGIWEQSLIEFANTRAGENIVSITDTLKMWFVESLQELLEQGTGMGVEVMARELFKQYSEVELWMARRIAQTETMIALGNSADLSARSLGLPMHKQWTCSGLMNTRDTHIVMDGVVVGGNEFFELPDCKMRFPCDTTGNAPASEIINCACTCLYIPD